MRGETISRYFLPQSPGAGPSSQPNITTPSSESSSSRKEHLQQAWKTLYASTLPSLARAHSPSQTKWPVSLDHCFARIVLDNVVGVDRPWTEVLTGPAWKTMNVEQLEGCLDLGQKIANGEVDLVLLDENSLSLRGKQSKVKVGRRSKNEGRATNSSQDSDSRKPADNTSPPTISDDEDMIPERKSTEDTDSGRTKRKVIDLTSPVEDECPSGVSPSPKHDSPSLKTRARLLQTVAIILPFTGTTSKQTPAPHCDLSPILHKLTTNPSLTPFRRHVLLLICLIPPGRFSTYLSLSTALDSSPRGIGTALRRNPYPGPKDGRDVPCHRILASGGGIGGFGGHWGEEEQGGKFAGEKRGLLRKEGVRFDVKGRAVGRPFDGFPNVEELERILSEAA